jgi:Zn-dependent protease
VFGSDFLQRAIIAAPVVLFSISVHEFFHAWSAYRFGDTTARDMGRLTLNPLAHFDFFGIIVLFASQFRFGWGKPVPVSLYNVRNPRLADFWVSAAGPLSNMGLALIAGTALRLLAVSSIQPIEPVVLILVQGVIINLSLAFFNLIPLFPLDGSHILRNLLPPAYEVALDRFNLVAPLLLILLLVLGVVNTILSPFILFFAQLFTGGRLG